MNINKMVKKMKNQVGARYIFADSRTLCRPKALRFHAFKEFKAFLVPELKKQGAKR